MTDASEPCDCDGDEPHCKHCPPECGMTAAERAQLVDGVRRHMGPDQSKVEQARVRVASFVAEMIVRVSRDPDYEIWGSSTRPDNVITLNDLADLIQA